MRGALGTMAVVYALWAWPAGAQVALQDALPNLTFVNPVDIQAPHDGTNRLFIVQRPGLIAVVPNDPAATSSSTFLDISSQVTTAQAEQGLLGMTFHPDFPDSPYVYVDYTAANPDRSVISRFTVSAANPDSAAATSERVIMEVAQPYPNHNAGQLAFGPDGTLHIGFGDGGDAGDPMGNAQNLTVLLGKMLRIDVDASDPPLPYAIPPDNPLVGNASGYREEIYAWGFRNPWRYSFDPPTGRLWAGDVGQSDYEEIDVVTKGGNYGWNIMEGDSCYNPPSGCDTTGITLPVWVYPHTQGRVSITGGYVYRGADIPALVGRYVYADFGSGTIYGLYYDGTVTLNDELVDTSKLISTFGLDAAGELYVASYVEGRIYRLVATATGVGHVPAPSGDGALAQNVPNPFYPHTRIAFDLTRDARARVDVFDVTGRLVTTLANRRYGAGAHRTMWDGRDRTGAECPSGVYFYRLLVDGRAVDTRRMVLLR